MIYAEHILVCIAVPLLLSLLFLRKKAKLLASGFLIGMVVCLLSAYIDGFINVASGMGTNDTAVFISPIIEELMKFLPLMFLLVLFNPEDEALLTGAVGISVGFAMFENCCYILTNGAENLAYILIRGLAVGVMHIVVMLSMTFGVMQARRANVLSLPAIIGAISLAMTFHGLYNLLVSEPGISSRIGYVLPLLTMGFLVIAFRGFRSGKDEEADVQ